MSTHLNKSNIPFYALALYLYGPLKKKKDKRKNWSYNIIELQTNSIIISSKTENQNLLSHAFYCLIHFPLTGQFGQQKTHRDRSRSPLKSLPDRVKKPTEQRTIKQQQPAGQKEAKLLRAIQFFKRKKRRGRGEKTAREGSGEREITEQQAGLTNPQAFASRPGPARRRGRTLLRSRGGSTHRQPAQCRRAPREWNTGEFGSPPAAAAAVGADSPERWCCSRGAPGTTKGRTAAGPRTRSGSAR